MPNCRTCGKWCQDENQVRMHQKTHLPFTVECYGCAEKFRTYHDMLSHLEKGFCSSGIDAEDLNESAAWCYQWAQWLDEDLRDELLERDAHYSSNFNHEDRPWKCPSCDNKWFKTLSALFAHVWTPSCDLDEATYPMNKLKRWLYRRHGQ